MSKPIMFTPGELYTVIIAICGAIVTIGAAITVIVKLFAKVKEPETQQNARLEKCEHDITEIYQKLVDHDLLFKHDKRRLDKLEDGNEVMSEAMLALLNHAINGNNTEDLRSAANKLNQYLIRRTRDEE